MGQCFPKTGHCALNASKLCHPILVESVLAPRLLVPRSAVRWQQFAALVMGGAAAAAAGGRGNWRGRSIVAAVMI